jgi:hypothetical protein
VKPLPSSSGRVKSLPCAMVLPIDDDVNVFSILEGEEAEGAPPPGEGPAGGLPSQFSPGLQYTAPSMVPTDADGSATVGAVGAQGIEWESSKSALRAARGRSDGSSNAVLKHGWTAEEDATIVRMVQLTGQKWSVIASALPGRTDDAVRNRYLRLQKKKSAGGTEPQSSTHLELIDCHATKRGDMWTVEEDARILSGVHTHGFKWQQIASLLPGRSANAVRNRYLRCGPATLANITGESDEASAATLQNPPLTSAPDERAKTEDFERQVSSCGASAATGQGPSPAGYATATSGEAGLMMTAEELLTAVGGACDDSEHGAIPFWDASALYGEALGALQDELLEPLGGAAGELE